MRACLEDESRARQAAEATLADREGEYSVQAAVMEAAQEQIRTLAGAVSQWQVGVLACVRARARVHAIDSHRVEGLARLCTATAKALGCPGALKMGPLAGEAQCGPSVSLLLFRPPPRLMRAACLPHTRRRTTAAPRRGAQSWPASWRRRARRQRRGARPQPLHRRWSSSSGRWRRRRRRWRRRRCRWGLHAAAGRGGQRSVVRVRGLLVRPLPGGLSVCVCGLPARGPVCKCARNVCRVEELAEVRTAAQIRAAGDKPFLPSSPAAPCLPDRTHFGACAGLQARSQPFLCMHAPSHAAPAPVLAGCRRKTPQRAALQRSWRRHCQRRRRRWRPRRRSVCCCGSSCRCARAGRAPTPSCAAQRLLAALEEEWGYPVQHQSVAGVSCHAHRVRGAGHMRASRTLSAWLYT